MSQYYFSQRADNGTREQSFSQHVHKHVHTIPTSSLMRLVVDLGAPRSGLYVEPHDNDFFQTTFIAPNTIVHHQPQKSLPRSEGCFEYGTGLTSAMHFP